MLRLEFPDARHVLDSQCRIVIPEAIIRPVFFEDKNTLPLFVTLANKGFPLFMRVQLYSRHRLLGSLCGSLIETKAAANLNGCDRLNATAVQRFTVQDHH
jgi:hypothetical protein